MIVRAIRVIIVIILITVSTNLNVINSYSKMEQAKFKYEKAFKEKARYDSMVEYKSRLTAIHSEFEKLALSGLSGVLNAEDVLGFTDRILEVYSDVQVTETSLVENVLNITMQSENSSDMESTILSFEMLISEYTYSLELVDGLYTLNIGLAVN